MGENILVYKLVEKMDLLIEKIGNIEEKLDKLIEEVKEGDYNVKIIIESCLK